MQPTPTGAASPSAPPSTTAPEATATAIPSAAGLPAPTILNLAWTERAPFRANLIPGEQSALEAWKGASVYHLDVRIADDYGSLALQEEVLYTNQESAPLDTIPFRLYPNLLGGDLTVSVVTVNGAPVEPEYELERSAMLVPLPKALLPGESVVLGVAATVDVPDSPEGNYGSFAFVDNVLALAHFYPFIPVYDDEGWNVEIPAPSGDIIYGDSSFYLVRVTAPTETVLVASGVRVAEETSDGEQTVTFAAGPVRDFYLVASERYVAEQTTVGETTINSYTFAGLEEVGEDVLRGAAQSLADFSERIGPYPYSEFDVVVTPNLALGIEYPGVVAITSRLYEPGSGSDDGTLASVREATVAHEAAHQWFYSVVGSDQLDEPWLDESLVQYQTWRYFVDEYGPEAAEGFRSSLTGRWESGGQQEIPIGLPVGDYTPPEYSAIVYGRGPLFFEALAQKMGQDTFDAFLRDYYQQYKFEIATGEGFKALAEQGCACDLTPLWEEWVVAP